MNFEGGWLGFFYGDGKSAFSCHSRRAENVLCERNDGVLSFSAACLAACGFSHWRAGGCVAAHTLQAFKHMPA